MWPARGQAQTRWPRPIRSVSSTLRAQPHPNSEGRSYIPSKGQEQKLNISFRCKTIQNPSLASYFIGFCCVKAYNYTVHRCFCVAHLVLLRANVKVDSFKSQSLEIDLCLLCGWAFKSLPWIHAVRRVSAAMVKRQHFNRFSFKDWYRAV